MKYIIEIEEKPLCVFDKDTQTFFPRLWRVKGFNSLVLDEEGLSRLEELNSDYINEHFGSLQDDAYKRGLEEGKAQAERGCKGCEYEGKTGEHLPCEYCKNNFRSQWTAKSDKIEVGDEVKWNSDLIVVTRLYENGDFDWCDGIGNDGTAFHILEKNARKTGRHLDIASILEDMRHD